MSDSKPQVYFGSLNGLADGYDDRGLSVPLSKVNIIIGQNNSGKSRLMRSVMIQKSHNKIMAMWSLGGRADFISSVKVFNESLQDMKSDFDLSFNDIKDYLRKVYDASLKSQIPKNSGDEGVSFFEDLDRFGVLGHVDLSSLNEFIIDGYDFGSLVTSFANYKDSIYDQIEPIVKGFLDVVEGDLIRQNKIDLLKQNIIRGRAVVYQSEIDALTHLEKEFINQIKRFVSQKIRTMFDRLFTPVMNDVGSLSALSKDILKMSRYYLPILRGTRPLVGRNDVNKYNPDQASYVYKNRTLNDYQSIKGHAEVFTGEDLYVRVHDLLCGDTEERELLNNYTDYLAQNFFRHLLVSEDDLKKSISLIPHKSRDVLDVKIGKLDARPIYDLGDGLQSIIILTFLVFTTKEDSIFFIEEPEQFLHPGMQRKILELFSKYPRHQFFFTTHSNHFIDMSIDFANVSVVKVSNDVEVDKFYIASSKGRDKDLLIELGVSPSSVHLCNAIFFVEGISERITLRYWLFLYQEYLKQQSGDSLVFVEDMHYAFFEYQGGNITHWRWLDDDGMDPAAIVGDFFIIADADGSSFDEHEKKWSGGDKSERLNKLEALNKENDIFYGLRVRELENLHTVGCVERFLSDKKGGRDLKFSGGLISVWKDNYLGSLIHLMIAGRIFEREFLSESELIEFFDESEPADDGVAQKAESYSVFERSMDKYGKFASPVKRKDSQDVERKFYLGTLTTDMKKKLAAFSADYYEKFEDLDEGAKELVKRMYDFVSRKNRLG